MLAGGLQLEILIARGFGIVVLAGGIFHPAEVICGQA
jgi:hypothetical protein